MLNNADDIRACKKNFEDLLKADIDRIQKQCPHSHVGHWNGEYLSGLHLNGGLDFPRRICLDCGFEEEGSWWSYSRESVWARRDCKPPILSGKIGGTERIFVLIAWDELVRARI